MPTWIVFCFLWDDPRFNPQAEFDKEHLITNPEIRYTEPHRKLRLAALNALYQDIAITTTQRNDYRRQAGYWHWVARQLNKRVSKILTPEQRENHLEILRQVEADAGAEESLGIDFGDYFDSLEPPPFKS